MDGKHRSILHALVIGILCSCVRVVHAKDTLLSTQSMRDGDQFLISANQTFEFGFFSPEGSSLRYVGIWYHKLPGQTIVWVANRDRPVFDTTGVLTFDHYGNMFIVDERGCMALLTYGFGATNGTAVTLLDTGNLVLRDTNNWSRILWQSFDYPTETLLPGMKLGLTGRRNRILMSWKSSSDPAPGVFSLGSNPKGAKQLFIWQMFTVYWDSGFWDGHKFPLLPPIPGIAALHYDDDYFSYSLKESSPMLRYVMSVSGKLQLFLWAQSEKEWLLFLSQPSPQCDVYNLCGDNGVCHEELTKYCQCLPGFEPGSMAEWQNEVTKGGCIRKTSLNCGSSNGTDQDRFRLIPRIKFPVGAKFLNASSRDECESSCFGSCSCTAYTFIAGACRLWYGNLKNTRVMENDTDHDTGGELYLRLSASEFGLDSSPAFSTWMILLIAAASSVLGSLVLVSCICYCLRRRKERVRSRQEKSILKWGAEIASMLREQGATGPDFTLFGFSCIKDATDNFSDECKLGEGGFGPVYKGKLPEGREVAVKRLSTSSRQGLEEFKNEIMLIAKLQHRNLVRLLGCCIQGEEKILVYEYMPNKSLDFFLFEPTRGAQVDWSRRFHIVKGIAQGLLYLHKHSRLRIIHRDLNASNILLDDEMSPKISDFGLARIFGSDETQASTNRVVGTYGYMSPEYASEGVFSVKSDVFSFGVILLEIVTGRRNAGFYQNGNSSNLLGYAWDLWSDGRWLELVDPVINDDTLHASELHRCIHVALLCVQDSACHRPTMSEVIALLGNENDSASLTAPKKPVFFSVSIETQTGYVKSSPSFAKQTCSLNLVSLTTMHPR